MSRIETFKIGEDVYIERVGSGRPPRRLRPDVRPVTTRAAEPGLPQAESGVDLLVRVGWAVLASVYFLAMVALLVYLAHVSSRPPAPNHHVRGGPYIPPGVHSPRPGWRPVRVTAYAYNSEVSQTDRDPWATACLTRPSEGTVAVSQDLFAPTGGRLKCGEIVRLGGVPYVVNDTMNRSHRRSVDVWMRYKRDAESWGIRRRMILEVSKWATIRSRSSRRGEDRSSCVPGSSGSLVSTVDTASWRSSQGITPTGWCSTSRSSGKTNSRSVRTTG